MMSAEEKERIVDAAIDLKLAGDREGAEKLLRQIPVAAETAKYIINAGGPGVLEWLEARGYDFSEYRTKYGEGGRA